MELGLTSSDWWPLNHHFTADPHASDSTGSLYVTTVSPRASSEKQPSKLCRKLLSHSLRGSDWCNLLHSSVWFARLSSGSLQPARQQRAVPSCCRVYFHSSASLHRWWESQRWRYLSADAGQFHRDTFLILQHPLQIRIEETDCCGWNDFLLLSYLSLSGHRRRAAGGTQLLWSDTEQVTWESERFPINTSHSFNIESKVVFFWQQSFYLSI